MKKLIFILIFIFSYSYEITDIKTYSQYVKPDNIQIFLNVETQNIQLNNLLKKISDIINSSKNICQKADYNFYPVYDKNGNFRIYKASINISCIFTKNKINEFSKILSSIQTKAKIKMNSINLVYENKEKILNILRKKAYKNAQTTAKKLSDTLNKQCFVTQISFNCPVNKKPIPLYRSYNTVTPLPIQKNKINLTVFYKIECY